MSPHQHLDTLTAGTDQFISLGFAWTPRSAPTAQFTPRALFHVARRLSPATVAVNKLFYFKIKLDNSPRFVLGSSVLSNLPGKTPVRYTVNLERNT